MIDLVNPMHDMIVAGHTFQLAPGATFDGRRFVYVVVSGPSGSRSATGVDLQHALTDLFSQIALARLS